MRSSTRLHFAALIGLVGGCTGQIEEDVPDGITPEQEAARKAWVVGAQPVLGANCAPRGFQERVTVRTARGAPEIRVPTNACMSVAIGHLLRRGS